jgi:hypothetical protein
MFPALLSTSRSLLARPGVLPLGAGLLAGVVAGTVLVASGSLTGAPPAELALVACPGAETVVARVASGKQMLVTARSADGLWLELYIGEPGADRGWAPTTALRFDDPPDRLPVHDCGSLVAVATLGPGQSGGPSPGTTIVATVGPPSSLEPGTSLPSSTIPAATSLAVPTHSLPPGVSAVPPTPTPAATQLPPPPTIQPTALPPTAVPSPTPDLAGPSITSISVVATLVGGIYYIDNLGNECGRGNTATINAFVTDSSGVNKPTIRLLFKDTNGVTHDQQMTLKFGTKAAYTSTITAGAWPPGELEWWITATDNLGNVRTTSKPPDPSLRIFRSYCFT